MKNLFILFFVSIFTLNLQAEKLTIVHEDWAEAQKIAKESKKLIIIDFYTTWCGPCKMFSANLAKNEELQELLSENFIMLKYDAEKDKEFNLSKKFHVRSYPTFVIVSPEVQYLDRITGGALESSESIDRFINFTNDAVELKGGGNYPKGYNNSLKNEYPTFYTKSMNREEKFNRESVKRYWADPRDYISEVNFAVLSAFGGSDKANKFYLENKEEYVKKFGKTAADQILQRMVSRKFSAAIKAKDEKQFEAAKEFAIKHIGAEDANLDYMEYSFAMATKDCTRMEKVVDGFMKKSEMAAMGINSVCWQIYESDCTNKAFLNKTTKWMQSAKPLTQDYAFLDTYACLLYKSKKYADAKTYMQKAIAKAKASGEKHDASLKVLQEIEQKLK